MYEIIFIYGSSRKINEKQKKKMTKIKMNVFRDRSEMISEFGRKIEYFVIFFFDKKKSFKKKKKGKKWHQQI